MIRRIASPILAVVLVAGFSHAQAAKPAPPASTPKAATSPAAPAIAPPQKAAPAAPKFPPVDPKNFTAEMPKPETVDAFLRAQIGFDAERIWQVAAVRKTLAPGFSEVEVLVANKDGRDQPRAFRLLITPDQKFAIQDSTPVPFGAHPFADARKILDAKADGPSRGAASKDLMIVEFSDFECPHCKAALPIMANLEKDYPQARFVYENFPLSNIHPWAHKAAAYSVCVAEQKNDAYFAFADAVFAEQEQITESNVDDMLKAAATKAGVDGAKVAACAVKPEALAKVDASVALAEELDVNSTPTIFINGRPIVMGPNLTYELLKKIVSYQAEMDGVKLPPEMKNLPK
jgi:protein-disulfide isomerase